MAKSNTSKWSLLEESSWLIVSEKITKGSRMKRWEICLDSRSSIPWETNLSHEFKHDFAITYRVRVNGRKLLRHMVEGCHYTPVDSSSGLKYKDQHCHIATSEFWICFPSMATEWDYYSKPSQRPNSSPWVPFLPPCDHRRFPQLHSNDYQRRQDNPAKLDLLQSMLTNSEVSDIWDMKTEAH